VEVADLKDLKVVAELARQQREEKREEEERERDRAMAVAVEKAGERVEEVVGRVEEKDVGSRDEVVKYEHYGLFHKYLNEKVLRVVVRIGDLGEQWFGYVKEGSGGSGRGRSGGGGGGGVWEEEGGAMVGDGRKGDGGVVVEEEEEGEMGSFAAFADASPVSSLDSNSTMKKNLFLLKRKQEAKKKRKTLQRATQHRADFNLYNGVGEEGR